MKACTKLSGAWLLCALLVAGCGSQDSYENPLRPVRVAVVKKHTVQRALRYSTNIEPFSQVNLAFQAGGYLRGILQVPGVDGRPRDVQQGDVVARDTVLATVDPSDYRQKVRQAQAQLASAQAALTKAKLDWGRAQALYGAQSLTKPDYDAAVQELGQAQAQVDGAVAQLGEAEITLAYCFLKAPSPGVVLQRSVEVGDLVGIGTLGFVISDVSSVKAVFGVPGLVLPHLKMGERFGIVTDSLPDREFQGRVTAISPAANTSVRVFEVELTIPNPDNLLKPGMIASLEVNRGLPQPSLTMVPIGAVVRSKTDPQGYAVYVLPGSADEQAAELRDVSLGQVAGNLIAVTQGVEPGERIIVTGASLVTDGEKVRVIP
ncbi:MAG: efflux RND transporter periplasmic adaptor subunit [Deltaproteobacteria bacterium]|nr:efflux RND transporter periplasmic adaptor subunit [Deltaproteobacteria bacterium]